ncbi:hypothetical protein [Spiroplasma endosymbiont of Megaselia nigra]|uniref:hypothetical protein n=1 Tax=Spiroplasma endosymbiont of Megaselia nigra TaxID=2478537 RepID=UPI000F89C1D2|nr:hypothetical protein [Spiroplasma endosymbiont of Megaselia nigra]RUO86044.1 hypothetical protein D9R21_05365 [Spiroplasma endosymbiont of Megaselia nigra]
MKKLLILLSVLTISGTAIPTVIANKPYVITVPNDYETEKINITKLKSNPLMVNVTNTNNNSKEIAGAILLEMMIANPDEETFVDIYYSFDDNINWWDFRNINLIKPDFSETYKDAILLATKDNEKFIGAFHFEATLKNDNPNQQVSIKDVVKNTDLGKIMVNNEEIILNKLKDKNEELVLSEVFLTNITEDSAILNVKENSQIYFHDETMKINFEIDISEWILTQEYFQDEEFNTSGNYTGGIIGIVNNEYALFTYMGNIYKSSLKNSNEQFELIKQDDDKKITSWYCYSMEKKGFFYYFDKSGYCYKISKQGKIIEIKKYNELSFSNVATNGIININGETGIVSYENNNLVIYFLDNELNIYKSKEIKLKSGDTGSKYSISLFKDSSGNIGFTSLNGIWLINNELDYYYRVKDNSSFGNNLSKLVVLDGDNYIVSDYVAGGRFVDKNFNYKKGLDLINNYSIMDIIPTNIKNEYYVLVGYDKHWDGPPTKVAFGKLTFKKL